MYRDTNKRTQPDWACTGCGYQRKSCTCPDPATTADKLRALVYLLAGLTLIVGLLLAYCLTMHRGMS